MKQTKHIPFCLSLLAATALFTACDSVLGDDDFVNQQGDTMQLTFTRSGDSSSATSGNLIFWKTAMNDFFTAEVPDLTAYGETKFNTGTPYPKDGTLISATGYSPANMLHTDDYQTLELPTGTKPGTLDVCAASQVIKGNYYSIFNENMVFEHTLTKVTFFVERDYTMVGSRDVNNITVTIPKNYLPTQWVWNKATAPDNAKYTAQQDTHADATLVFAHPSTLVGTNTVNIGTAYLMLPADNNGQLTDINIKADIYRTESIEKEKTIDQTIPVQLYAGENSDPVDKANPGEAYEIVIKFQQNSFTLVARKSDWEKGGLIYVPVKP